MSILTKKGQAAVEFTILFAIALAMLTSFMYFSRGQFDTIHEKQIEIDTDKLANEMVSYATFSLRTPHLKLFVLWTCSQRTFLLNTKRRRGFAPN